MNLLSRLCRNWPSRWDWILLVIIIDLEDLQVAVLILKDQKDTVALANGSPKFEE
jgi:hypothetical protein